MRLKAAGLVLAQKVLQHALGGDHYIVDLIHLPPDVSVGLAYSHRAHHISMNEMGEAYQLFFAILFIYLCWVFLGDSRTL